MFDNTTFQGRTSPLGEMIAVHQGIAIIPERNTLACLVPAGGALPAHYEAHKNLKAVSYSTNIEHIGPVGTAGHSPVHITNYTRMEDHIIDIADGEHRSSRLGRIQKKVILDSSGFNTNSDIAVKTLNEVYKKKPASIANRTKCFVTDSLRRASIKAK